MHQCGETAYRCNFLDVSSKLSFAPQLRNFLDDSSSVNESKRKLEHRTSQWRARRFERARQSRLLVANIKCTSELLEKESVHVIGEVARTIEQSCGSIDRFLRDRDFLLMKIVLTYFSILQTEKQQHLHHVLAELKTLEKKLHHIGVDRNLQVFSAAVNSETKNKVELSMLARDSEQYQRCRKAVKDNTASNIFSNEYFEGIKVLNVMNVKHALLSQQISSCAKRQGEKGKVKGLFCCLSAEGIHSFCVYGLYRQKVLSRNVSRNLDVFKPAWYSRELPTCTKGHQQRACEIVRDRGLNCSNVEACPEYRAAQMAGEQRSQALLHFTENVDMPYLALCRVLLCKTYDVSGKITEADIAFAIESDFDSIHSSECDDYILLNPKCVLPEFVMHVQLEWSIPATLPKNACGFEPVFPSGFHPATFDAAVEVAVSDDIAVRDSLLWYSGKHSLKRSLLSQEGGGLIPYLKRNEDTFHFASSATGYEGLVASICGIGRSTPAIGTEKQSLLRDLEYVVTSIDKYIRELVRSHVGRG